MTFYSGIAKRIHYRWEISLQDNRTFNRIKISKEIMMTLLFQLIRVAKINNPGVNSISMVAVALFKIVKYLINSLMRI